MSRVGFARRQDSEDETEVGKVFADISLPDSSSCNGCSAKMIRLSSINSPKLFSMAEITPVAEVITERKKNEKSISQPIRRKGLREMEDPFQKYNVPDLVIQFILSNLRKRDLFSAMQTCKKFYDVGHSLKSWTITDVTERSVSEITLYGIMRRKVLVLRLSAVKIIPDSLIPRNLFEEIVYSKSRLEVLDLSGSFLTHRQLLMVLRPCEKLRCLSLEGNLLEDDIASCVAANPNLRQLDISMTRGLTVNGALNIFRRCQRLEELNASWCGLDSEILHILVENISSKIRKLNLSGSVRKSGLNDEHVNMLILGCPNLADLDMSDNLEIGDITIRHILSKQCCLKTLSINRCFGIDPNAMTLLNDTTTLSHLNVHGCISEENLQLFTAMCNRLIVNKQFFNYTAKPITNPSTSTSIYGYRVVEDR